MIRTPVEPLSAQRPTLAILACGVLLPLVLAGCSGESLLPTASSDAASAPAPTGITRDALIGRWGVASFHADKDRKRTEAEARSQCKQPYVIAKGPGDGVMMHVADDPKLYELRLKAGPGGKTYLGFEAPAGDPQDRELLSVKPKEIVARFVDPDVSTRYGTFIYSRCS
jgi:hypothetical protein